MSEKTPLEELNEIAEAIEHLETDDTVKISIEDRNVPIIGKVTQKKNEIQGEDSFEAIVKESDGKKYKLHADWKPPQPDGNDRQYPTVNVKEGVLGKDYLEEITEIKIL